MPATAPVITSITAARNQHRVYGDHRGLFEHAGADHGELQFNGTNLGTTTLSVPVNTIFASWYQSSAAGQYGSNFTYTQPFTTSNPQAVTSVTVTLVNGVGTSPAAGATLQ